MRTMRILRDEAKTSARRVLIINPNTIEGFTTSMRRNLVSHDVALDFYTAPGTVARGINGAFDSVMSAAACLDELENCLNQWDAFIVACFSAHPMVVALRERTAAPVISILEAPLLFASVLGSRVAILTSTPQWERLLVRDIATYGLTNMVQAGITSSGMTIAELEDLPQEEVRRRIGTIARDELFTRRKADVVVLGCAGMAGLEETVKEACGGNVTVLDPVRTALEMATGMLRLGATTSKAGVYASSAST